MIHHTTHFKSLLEKARFSRIFQYTKDTSEEFLLLFSFFLISSFKAPQPFCDEDDDGFGNGSNDQAFYAFRFVPIYGFRGYCHLQEAVAYKDTLSRTHIRKEEEEPFSILH